MQFTSGYYHALDKYGDVKPIGATKRPDIPLEANDFQTNLSPQEIGTTLNPFVSPIEGLHARLKEGTGKIEFEFFGSGKGQKDRYTPESFGTTERQDLKNLAELNKIKTSVHATVNVQGLAGLGREGFREEQREESYRELRRAIDFAADVTKGGAIVVHTGEWQRPIEEYHGKQGFRGYPGEEKEAQFFVVDSNTGSFVSSISKNRIVYEPVYWTAGEQAKKFNYKKTSDGKYIDSNGNNLEPTDWIDIKGNYVDGRDPEQLFQRVPYWDEKRVQFKTKRMDWKALEEKRDWFNRRYESNYTTEEIFARTQLENQIIQAKGHSLFYGKHYEDEKRDFDATIKAYKFFKEIEDKTSKEEQWKLLMNEAGFRGVADQLSKDFREDNTKLPSEFLKHRMRQLELSMKHIHEASAASDVMAMNHQEIYDRIKTAKDYGIEKTAETLAQAGMLAMEKTKQKNLPEPLFIAPENWDTRQFGSHPHELREIIEKGRERMTKDLEVRYGKTEAKKMASQHIKATLDVGHLNLWRRHFERKPGESLQETDRRFNKWLLDESAKLVKDGIVGHVHLSDNMGFDDEHLTPGQGNIPMKAFVKKMEELGMKDMIIETGSFNPVTSPQDTMSYLGSPVYSGTQVPQRFEGFHQRHFGYQAPPFYIVGAYSPSEEWKLWSEVPFE